jgi:phosphoserine aminotransferase
MSATTPRPEPVSGSLPERRERSWNFGPGPAYLPEDVIREAQDALWRFDGTGMGVAEISHRDPRFLGLVEGLEERIRRLLQLPDSHTLLFMAGGARPHFSLVPLNLSWPHRKRAAYALTGYWSRLARTDASVLIQTEAAVEVPPGGTPEQPTRIPDPAHWACVEPVDYLYYTDNESIDGIEFASPPPVRDGLRLVSDMTANLFSRPIPRLESFSLIFAGAQKNLGITGLAIVILRKADLVGSLEGWPRYLLYREWVAHHSMVNTPPTLNLYLADLMARWMEKEGGLAALAVRNRKKADLLYAAIDQSGGFYRNGISPASRSRMNVPFRLADESQTPRFLAAAADAGLVQLAGHHSVGGCRASIYNAMPEAGVRHLTEFMREYQRTAG